MTPPLSEKKRGGEIQRSVLPQLAPPMMRVGKCEKGLQTLSNEIPFFFKTSDFYIKMKNGKYFHKLYKISQTKRVARSM